MGRRVALLLRTEKPHTLLEVAALIRRKAANGRMVAKVRCMKRRGPLKPDYHLFIDQQKVAKSVQT